MNNTRGISAIVATVLIILITVASIGIIWGAIIPLIQQNINSIDLDLVQLEIVTIEGYTGYDEGENLLTLQVSRGIDGANLSGIQFIFENQGNSASYVSRDVVGENQKKTYKFFLEDFSSEGSVSIAPVAEDDSFGISSPAFFNFGNVDLTHEADYQFVTSEIPSALLEGLVSWWDFEADFTDRANIHDAAAQGDITLFNGSAVFDGSGDGLVISSDVSYGPSITFLGWARTNSPGVWQTVISSQVSSSTSEVFHLRGMADQRYNFRADSSSSWIDSGNWIHSSSKPFSSTSWHHVAVSIEGTLVSIYINGVLEGQKVMNDPVSFTTSINRIGYHNSFAQPFNGEMDNIMLYNKELSQKEIEEIFLIQCPGKGIC